MMPVDQFLKAERHPDHLQVSEDITTMLAFCEIASRKKGICLPDCVTYVIRNIVGASLKKGLSSELDDQEGYLLRGSRNLGSLITGRQQEADP